MPDGYYNQFWTNSASSVATSNANVYYPIYTGSSSQQAVLRDPVGERYADMKPPKEKTELEWLDDRVAEVLGWAA